MKQLRGTDAESCRQAAEDLAQMGEEARPAALALVAACGRGDDELSEWAVAALEQMGAPVLDDLPALCQLLKSKNEPTAYWAATLIGRLQQQAAAAVRPLAECVKQTASDSVRQRAIWALGQIGSAAQEATPVLQQAAAGSGPRTARLAQEAMDRIGGS
jgi:HEAT repeat protein